MLSPIVSSARSSRPARRFGRDAAGASAVEFALVLPIMLVIWVGMSELAHAIDNWRKVTLLARTVSDLTSQGDQDSDPIASATMSDILAASGAVLRPFGTANLKIKVSALAVDWTASLTNPRVCSSLTIDPTDVRPTGIATDLTIPNGFNGNGNRYVLAEVSMPYAPMLGTALAKVVGVTKPITLKSSFVWPVRNGVVHNSVISKPEVVMPGGSACP